MAMAGDAVDRSSVTGRDRRDRPPPRLHVSEVFQLQGVVVRCLALVAIGVLTGRLGALEARVRRQMRQLATPPDVEAMNTDELVGSMLEWAAGITGAPRMLLAWEEAKEPWLELVLWDRGKYRRMRERSDAFSPLVAAGLSKHADFLHELSAGCLVAVPGVFRNWTGEPLGAGLRERFSIGAVLAVAITGEEVKGRLFFLDKLRMTSDDLILGEITAHTLADRLRALRLARCLSAAALTEESFAWAGTSTMGRFTCSPGWPSRWSDCCASRSPRLRTPGTCSSRSSAASRRSNGRCGSYSRDSGPRRRHGDPTWVRRRA